MIKLNDQGIQVRIVQLLLNSLLNPSPHLEVDGHFGLATQRGVKSFQTLHGLPPDGNVDPKTLSR
jgi:peptidoglycan hydrolase-like protein with peptidoglycan-binding domain